MKLMGFFENRESREHGFILIVTENSSNALDFAKMTFSGEDVVSELEFHEYRESAFLPTLPVSDPITYYKHYINEKEKHVACVYRASGCVDFYYDYELIDSSQGI